MYIYWAKCNQVENKKKKNKKKHSKRHTTKCDLKKEKKTIQKLFYTRITAIPIFSNKINIYIIFIN